MYQVVDYIKKHRFLLLIIIPAFLLFMLIVVPSGSYFCFQKECGYYFWGVHGRDAIWHLAIANVSFKQYPFVAPTYSGEYLLGYNYLLDLFIFLLSKLGISSVFSYFKLIPILWFGIFTGLLIALARKLKDNPLFVGLFIFFSYFSGSFSYLLKLYHSRTIQDSSMLLPQPILHSMSNLQYALSLLFLLVILILVKDNKINLKKMIACGASIFFMFGLKFYGGLVGFFLLSLYLVLQILRNSVKNFIIYSFVLGIFVLLAIFIFYDPLASYKTGSVFGFSPFALVHTITEAPDQFYLQNMTDARYFLQQFGIGPRLILIEGLNLIIFLFFYLGTRFFGLVYIGFLLLKKRLDKFDLVVISTIFFSILLTVTLVQKGVWWNTIQFFFYAIFLSTIYLTKLTHDLLSKKKKITLLLACMIIILSVPTSYDLFWHFLNTSRANYLPKEEIEALAYLKKQPNGVVLIPILEEERKNAPGNLPLNYYRDSSYVAAFSDKQLYIAEIQSLGVTSVPFEKRLEKVIKLDCSVLNEVDYVYEIKKAPNTKKIMNKCKPKNATKVFENKSVKIYSLRF